MKKKVLVPVVTAMGITALGAGAAVSAEESTDARWAFAAYTMDSEENGIGSVYYVSDYFTTEAVNPQTAEAYTEEEIAAIRAAASEETEGYCYRIPENAVIGISAYGQGTIYWFDMEGAAAVVSHSDPLTLDVENECVVTADGEEVAAAVEVTSDWAYAAFTLDSEENGVGSIYYAADYFTTDAVNPSTTENYTEDEVTAILENASEETEGYVYGIPAGAVIGMSVYGSDTVYWYDAEGAAAIVSHSDPLTLDAETGDLATAEGEVVASPME